MPSSAGSKPALRSAPEEKPRPAPVTSTERTESSAASFSTTLLSSWPNSAVQALSVSGRLRVRRPTPSVTSPITTSHPPRARAYPAGMLLDSLEWLGHSGFRVRTREGVVYIDPYRVKDGPEADLILITHGHYDHFSPQDVERLSTSRTWLVGPAAVAGRVSGQGHSIAPGEMLDEELVRGVHVSAVAAYNTSKRSPEGRV